jgi:hypothetical protein
MNVVDPGHVYTLDPLDGDLPQSLTFVKRQGPLYPGNVGSHPGTTTQEVLRALIDRLRYVNRQLPCPETAASVTLLETAVYLLEARAAARHGRPVRFSLPDAVAGTGKCQKCGHVSCPGCPTGSPVAPSIV